MDTTDLANDTITDLLRAAWLIEQARRDVYERWSQRDARFADSAARAAQRADVVLAGLQARDRRPDQDLVEAHASWLRGLAGDGPGETPLADLFVARIGDWVEAHAGPFIAEGAHRLKELGDEERATLTFPESLPQSPPYEPVPALPADPPGEVIFRFGILADLHFGSPRGDDMARAAIEDLNRSGAELVIQLGDLTDHGNRSEFEAATEALAKLEMPCVTMMGNHDVYSIEEERLAGAEYYPEAFGRAPDGALVEHKGFRFAVLDSATQAASPFGVFDFITGTFQDAAGGAVVHGSLTPPQHDILADVAAPGSPPAFVFLHHPPQPFTAFPPILFGLCDADSGRLHATVDSGNVWGVFAGHTHRNARTRDYGGVPAQEVAMPRDYPYGFALVDVTDAGYAYRFVQLSDEELLRKSYPLAGRLFRRYGLGPRHARSFVWTPNGPA